MASFIRRLVGRWSRSNLLVGTPGPRQSSYDGEPWLHPYLTAQNIQRFRAYSEGVWEIAKRNAASNKKALRIIFSVNMAQSMYNWARLAMAYGVTTELVLHPMDNSAISAPQWEDFDGEYANVLDGPGFLECAKSFVPEVPCSTPNLESGDFLQVYSRAKSGDLKALLHKLAVSDSMRYEVFDAHPQFATYFDWAQSLSNADVICSASAPFAAYASGRPYCLLSVGGDLQIDCGRGDWYGQAMTLAFNGARFLFVTNPHTLGHSRRLGLTNGIYLPYPMDTRRYCPGNGLARMRWEAEYGPGVYVLTTARLDSAVKGHDEDFFKMLVTLARENPALHFVFLAWGKNAEEFRQRVSTQGLEKQLIVLCPVGKKRLIDYYRSCDIVLDQFVYGYLGATALEAAAVGKPVVMKIRSEQYAPLYADDVAPVVNASKAMEIGNAIRMLASDRELREKLGRDLRAWAVRNHGEEHATQLMVAMLRLAADRVPLPKDLVNPLCDPESKEEATYHQSCLRPAT